MLQSTWSLPPQPLLEANPTPLNYPVAALGDLLGPAVERMAEVMGVPQAMAAQSVLATSALATQGHANVHLDGRVYGRQLSYAGPQALKDLFGGGHFATVKTHSDRWQAFVR